MNQITVEECQRVSISQLNLPPDTLNVEVNTQIVSLTRTNCYYGGERFWFNCPTCSKRVGTLYRKPLSDYFLCRHCQNLTYQLRKYHRSQHEMLLKQFKILN